MDEHRRAALWRSAWPTQILCLTFLFLVLAVPLARQVSCPVLSLVLVSLFQSVAQVAGSFVSEQSGVPPCVPCSRPRLLRPRSALRAPACFLIKSVSL